MSESSNYVEAQYEKFLLVLHCSAKHPVLPTSGSTSDTVIQPTPPFPISGSVSSVVSHLTLFYQIGVHIHHRKCQLLQKTVNAHHAINHTARMEKIPGLCIQSAWKM